MPAPANDNFADAILLAGVSGTDTSVTDNSAATTEVDEPTGSHVPNGIHQTVWFKWVAPASGVTTVDTLGSLTPVPTVLDTTLAVWTGTTLADLVEVDSNDDGPVDATSRVTFTAVGGTTYWIHVGAYDAGVNGAYVLNWLLAPVPPNDDFANAILLVGPGNTGTVTVPDCSTATTEVDEPVGTLIPLNHQTVWYRWVAPSNVTVTFDTTGSEVVADSSPLDTLLAVWTGTTLTDLVEVASNDDEVFPGIVVTSLVTFDAVEGTTYWIQVGVVSSSGQLGEPALLVLNGAGVPFTAPVFVRHEVVVKLYDLASNELADITPIALEKTLRRRAWPSRSFTVQAPAGHALLTTVADDGYPNLRKGNRKLLVWEDGQIIFHGRVFGIERTGDGTRNLATINAFDPGMELGYDSEDRAGRVVRGATDADAGYDGNFINPQFKSSVPAQDEISGPDLIKQILTNSQETGAEADPSPGEGPLPIDLDTGTFDLNVPPAIDLSPAHTMSWPILIGDFITMLIDTGVVDVDMRPVDPDEGFDPYVMVALSAVSSQGTDRSGTVHFDYWTGSKNAMACRHVEDFATINNKLYDYLGPPTATGTRFAAGNITPGSPGTTVDPSTSRTLYGGQFMQIRVLDTLGTSGDARPLYLAGWNAEQGYRVEPRDMLFVTPAPDRKGLFEPPADFDVGDLIAVNVGAELGLAIAATQRVFGYDKTWDRQGIARVSGLLTSADAA